MIINSSRNHSITFTYYDNEGCRKKLKIEPGDNVTRTEVWETIKEQYEKRSQIYFRGITTKKGDSK